MRRTRGPRSAARRRPRCRPPSSAAIASSVLVLPMSPHRTKRRDMAAIPTGADDAERMPSPLRHARVRAAGEDRRPRRRERRAARGAARRASMCACCCPATRGARGRRADVTRSRRSRRAGCWAARRCSSRTCPSGVPLWLLDCPLLYDRGGGPYQDDAGAGLGRQRAALRRSRRASRRCSRTTRARSSWRPDVSTATTGRRRSRPSTRASPRRRRGGVAAHHPQPRVPGRVPACDAADALELPPREPGRRRRRSSTGRLSFLKGGLVYADAITTVSPTYAREIQTRDAGLRAGRRAARARSDHLYGILNGIDTTRGTPRPTRSSRAATGPLAREEVARTSSRCSAAWAWPADADAPLFGMVSRLTQQKGIDLIADAAAALAAMPAQLAVLGAGRARAGGGAADAAPARIPAGRGARSASTSRSRTCSRPAPTCSSCPRASSRAA